ncbi:hypothetical protein EDB85DRAFT_2001121 [Lactarius pseudohatsudake]|nr:hypothetical protein EDB85DRAFT_2001121 [Lactarius pseudohatsudake]
MLASTAGLAASSRRASSVPASVLAQLLPANQQQLVAPTDAPTFVALVTGFQKFTCAHQGGEWAPNGFAGQLFDISGLFPGSEFSKIQNDAYFDWVGSPSTDPLDPAFAKQVEDKYGIPLSGHILCPFWCQWYSDWQALTSTSGKFASTIFRCEPGDLDQAKFTAQLFFYGSKL